MRKILQISCLLVLGTPCAMACEFCGCSSGNYFIGPFPQFRNYFVGTRYTFRSFNTTLAADPSQYSKDFYQTLEVWGGVNIGRKWQVLGFVPYNMNRQKSDDGVKTATGLGDATLLVNYNLLKTVRLDGLNHRLWVGGGVKLPTGTYAPDPDDLNPSANMQPGTGSLDFIASTLYSMQLDAWSVNIAATYRMNREAEGFQFGNRLATSLFVYRSFSTVQATFNPTVGLLHEDLGRNKANQVEIESTGGHGLLGAIGMDTNLKRVTVGFNLQLPIYQHYSAGQTETKVRGMLHVTYAF